MNKIALVLVFALGYVLGARAGRRRYEQIREKAQQLWNDEHVQSAVHSAGELAGKGAEFVGEKAGDLLDKAVDKARSGA